MRLVADIGTTILALSAILGFAARRFRQRRRANNLEHVRQLLVENKQIDEMREEIKRGDT